jgi:hypothetical protein
MILAGFLGFLNTSKIKTFVKVIKFLLWNFSRWEAPTSQLQDGRLGEKDDDDLKRYNLRTKF